MSTDPRATLLDRLANQPRFDLIVIGGGATGLGVAVDAAQRGLAVALFEAHDFAKGTSSRATKLLHGGVRYLAQGQLSLVHEALRERGILLRNAPHLSRPLAFVVPLYGPRGAWLDRWFYGGGLKAYDLLAGQRSLGSSHHLNETMARGALPGLRRERLVGAIRYWDGQFDDARLALALARTADDLSALVLNHCPVEGLLHAPDSGRVDGVVVTDAETGQRHEVRAGTVVNATGVWVDALRRVDEAAAEPMVSPSQGIHLVVDRSFLPGDNALLVPRTADGRVLFAVPWHGKVLLGTTDTPRQDLPLEPQPLAGEIEFVLSESARYLARAPRLEDALSCWVGLRPLVRPPGGTAAATRRLSREHAVVVSPTGLVTVTGGKWTTYRAMAEDVLDVCMAQAGLPARPAGGTRTLTLHGAPAATPLGAEPLAAGAAAAGAVTARAAAAGPLASARDLPADPGVLSPEDRAAMPAYGSDATRVAALPGADRRIALGLTEAMVRHAVRHEYARDVEDVLARRSRLLFLDARAAAAAADDVATIIADELGAGFDAAASAQAVIELARHYLPQTAAAASDGLTGAQAAGSNRPGPQAAPASDGQPPYHRDL